ncbi:MULTISPECIES: non-ribosomal peptide synthetase [Saccharothrix]|uniref:non-ribosomal peptide synthetase n=1 Tax=Saccharothrix TaxID=2071 RepID=UPI00093C56DF|nr:non-ribosomal peptide synthetase [Saccharothrix sp. CB00851]OKI31968.1 hypothetical protein A6A25_26320 [Saccharothrix sp. CB00851]
MDDNHRLLHLLVHDQATRTPDAVALASDDGQMTYRELSAAATRLAGVLRQRYDVRPDTPVGLLVDRGPELVVGILGILSAGGAYVPMDTDAPAAHLSALCAGARIDVCLSDRALARRLPPGVSAVWPDDLPQHDGGAPADVSMDNLVSVYYTSGSTGAPKGVANTHRGWANRMAWMQRKHRLRPGETVLQKTTITFDDSAVEVLWPLTCGGRVALLAPGAHRDPRAIVEAAQRHRVAVLQFVPSVLRLFLASLTPADLPGLVALRCVVSSGEALSPDLVAAFATALPGRELHNQWGLTEVSIDSTIWTCVPEVDGAADAVPIGHPIDGNDVHLLDERLRPVPIGVPGEIYLGGVGLARGYLHDPRRTAASFVPDPFGAGGRIYRTGDLGVRRADGAIVFLGRADDQVKIRGIRVEPAVTERALRRHPAVRDVVVTAPEHGGTRRLVAHVVPRDPDHAGVEADLRRVLADELPAAQLPSAYVFLAALPLTSSGKVDRRSLPRPADDVVGTPPGTATEVLLADLWSEVVGSSAVDVDRDFFAAGGDSLAAATLAVRVSGAVGVDARVGLFFANRTIRSAAAAIDRLPRRDGPQPHRQDDLTPSPGQERMLVLDRVLARRDTYHCREGLRLRGPVDEQALRRALDHVVSRHDVLRTVFAGPDGRPTVLLRAPVPLTVGDVSGLPAPGRMEAALRLAAASAEAIRLDTGPVLAVDLVHLGADDHVLCVTVHHVAFDDRSSDVFWRDLGAAYGALRDGRAPALPPLSLRYRDFAAWQRAKPVEPQVGYWRDRTADLAPLPLSTGTPGGIGAAVTEALPADLVTRLRDLAAARGTTLYTALLAAYQVLLGRYTATPDVATGIFVAQRAHADLDEVVGFFLGTVLVRTDLSGARTFADVLGLVGAELAGALDHADVPYERIVKEFRRGGGVGVPVRAAFALDRVTPDPWRLPGLESSRLELPDTSARFDLSATVTRAGDRTRVCFTYDTGVLDRATVDGMARRYVELLRAVATDPEVPLDSAITEPRTTEPPTPVVPNPADATTSTAPRTARPTAPAPPTGGHLHEQVHAHAAAHPDDVAVVDPRGEWTYSRLSRAATAVAAGLGDVAPDTLVAVFLDRDATVVAALLGVLTSGAAYLPLDVDTPAARLGLIIDDARPSRIITHSALLARLPRTRPEIVLVDRLDLGRAAALPDHRPHPDHLAYVIHTSGSTGRPKGVLITHRALDYFTGAIRRRLDLGPRDRVLAATTVSFDIAVLELLVPLTVGARVVVATRADARDPARLHRMVDRHAVTVLQATPSGWRLLVDSGWPGRRLTALSGGEALDARLARAIRDRTGTLVNLYGPTETTIWSTAADVADDERTPPIGVPLDGTAAHVLDAAMRPVPPGAVGELCLGGDGVARGYLGRPGLTSRRFVADPSGGGGRLYRTGDLVRRRADGVLEFVGRTDRQVKVRGHRVEPDEVEVVLGGHPSVSACAVVVETGPSGPRLVAYAAPAPGRLPTAEELRAHLRRHLPEHMVPGTVVVLDALPLTPNGKLDRRALTRPPRAPGEAPRGPHEEQVAAVFAEVLGVDEVARDDDFLALGGDSLLAVRVQARLGQRHGLHVELRDLLATPTVARVAAAARSGAGHVVIPAVSRERPLPLSPGQLRLWFLHRLRPDRVDHHLPLAHRLDGPLDADALATAFADLVARHEVLRTRHVPHADEPVQVIDPSGPALVRADLRHLPDPAAAADRVLRDLAGTPFDLAVEHPVRASLIRVSDTTHHLVLVLHHIAADAWSLDVLTAELAHRYGAANPAAPLPVQYADFAAWQRSRPTGNDDLAYWARRLGDLTPVRLPTDRPRPEVPSHRGTTHRHHLPASLVTDLERRARALDTTPFTVLLAAFHVLLGRCGRTADVATATFVGDRPHVDLEPVIGFFVDTVVLRSAPTVDRAFTDHLREVHDHLLDAHAHRSVPYERVVEHLRPDRDVHVDPLARVAFTVERPGALRLAGLDVTPLPTPPVPAKFDLSVTATLLADGADVDFSYHADLFEPETVALLARRYEHVLRQVVADPTTLIGDVSVTAPGEAPSLLGTTDPRPRDETLEEAFHAQARRTPEAVALLAGAERITYARLRARVNGLARHLREDHGVGPEVPVAVYLDRGPDLVVALLGVLTAGGVYLPLDVDHPAERHAAALASTRPPVVLTSTDRLGALPVADAAVVVVDAVPTADTAPVRTAPPDGLAYVVHTSGSTGRPKTLAMTHRGAVNYLDYVREVSGVAPGDVVLQLAAPGFDASLREILGPLGAGAAVAFPPPGPRRVADLVREAVDRGVTAILAVVPTLLEALAREGARQGVGLPRLRVVLVSGEALTGKLVDAVRVLAPDAEVVNQYGPSECTMTSTYARVERDGGEPSVGVPIPNMRCYVLDEVLRPVPPGVPGEVYLAGPGLARCYLGAPAATAERLLADPFGPPGSRMYRTGDLGRVVGGNLRFLGRVDRQVKVRGVRVEPAETEAAMAARADVRRAAVVPRADGSGLVGYYLPRPGSTLTGDGLRDHLRRVLPAAAVPDVVLAVPEFPVTTTGKVNYAALDPDPPVGTGFVRPRDALELTATRVWEEVLGVDRVGVDDDFFALGGHSLQAVGVADRLERAVGRPVPLSLVFTEPTVRRLCAAIRDDTRPTVGGAVRMRAGDPGRPPLFLLHPQSGDICCYFDLAHLLDPGLPVHGIEAVGLADDTPPLTAVEDMARHYLDLIREVSPTGPYLLAGWSFGGNAAFEVARLLEAEGDTVGFLGVIDARVFGRDPLDGRYLAEDDIGRYAFIAGVEVSGLAEDEALAVLARHAVAADRVTAYGGLPAVRRMVRVFTANDHAAERYHPTSGITADIHLFKAARTHPTLPTPPVDPAGWAERTSGRLVTELLPGDHHDLLREPCVSSLAVALSAALSRAVAG